MKPMCHHSDNDSDIALHSRVTVVLFLLEASLTHLFSILEPAVVTSKRPWSSRALKESRERFRSTGRYFRYLHHCLCNHCLKDQSIWPQFAKPKKRTKVKPKGFFISYSIALKFAVKELDMFPRKCFFYFLRFSIFKCFIQTHFVLMVEKSSKFMFFGSKNIFANFLKTKTKIKM